MKNIRLGLSLLIVVITLLIFVVSCVAFTKIKFETTKAEEFLSLREYEMALEHYQKALKLKPSDPEILAKMAWIYYRMENIPEAIARFKEIIEKHPEYYEAYYGFWLTRWVTSNEDEKTMLKKQIKEEMENLLKSRKPSDKLYATVFELLDEIDETERANEIKQLLLEKYPESKELEDVGQRCFESILRAGWELSKRAPLAEKFIKEFPKHKMTSLAYRILLSYHWRETKDKEKVKQICQEWLKTHQDDPMALYVASRLYSEMDIDPQQAINWAKKCLELVKQDKKIKPFWYDEWQFNMAVRIYEAYGNLGWAYYKSGDMVKAEQFLTRGLAYFMGHNRLWYHLGRVYADTGRLQEAIEAYAYSLMARQDIPELIDYLKKSLKQLFPGETDEFYDEIIAEMHRFYAIREGVAYFTDITEESGLIKAHGRRMAWGDYDNDGWQDLLLDGCRLWKNLGNGRFEEVTNSAGITGHFSGGVWADFDNDGFLDFFSIGIADALWRNNGDGTFTNVTNQLGDLSDNFPSEGAAWGDYNRDGFVDLYVANYEKPGKQLAQGTPDILWHNVAGKRFHNATIDAGVVSKEPMCGRGVSWADYNNDGWLDIFVSNYRLDPNFLWRNNGNGTFTNVARAVGVEGVAKDGYFGHTIGSDWGDYDNDGNLDLFCANLAHPRYIEFSNMSYLFRNQGEPDYNFIDMRKPSGILYEETHTHPAWCDYDNDGFLDLYITSVYDGRPSFLYRQTKDHRFIDVTWLSGTRTTDGWGAAWADFDNDGDMDLIVAGKDKNRHRLFLFRNETTRLLPENHWLKIKLVGNDCNRAAIGARVTITIPTKEKYIREVSGGSGTTCQNSLVQHFGLGRYNGPIDVSIRWPCGKIQNLTTYSNRMITVKEE